MLLRTTIGSWPDSSQYTITNRSFKRRSTSPLLSLSRGQKFVVGDLVRVEKQEVERSPCQGGLT